MKLYYCYLQIDKKIKINTIIIKLHIFPNILSFINKYLQQKIRKKNYVYTNIYYRERLIGMKSYEKWILWKWLALLERLWAGFFLGGISSAPTQPYKGKLYLDNIQRIRICKIRNPIRLPWFLKSTFKCFSNHGLH